MVGTSRPSVSVIIAAYMQARELSRTLPRLIKQEYCGRIEYLICDDGSSDATFRCIRKWQRDADIRYLWQPDLGFRLARSRNNGLRCAKGDIVVCVDADLCVARDFIAKHVAAQASVASLVCGGRKRVFERDLQKVPVDAAVNRILSEPKLFAQQRSDDSFQLKHARTPNPWVACIGANFSFVRPPSGVFFDETFEGWGGEDQEFACRLWKKHGYKVVVKTEISGVQIEQGAPEMFSNMRPKTQREITQYLRNVIHFIDSLPDIDTSPVCCGLAFYAYDPSRERWTYADRPRFDQAYIAEVLRRARWWLAQPTNAHLLKRRQDECYGERLESEQ